MSVPVVRPAARREAVKSEGHTLQSVALRFSALASEKSRDAHLHFPADFIHCDSQGW